jgi:hypothetical protein
MCASDLVYFYLMRYQKLICCNNYAEKSASIQFFVDCLLYYIHLQFRVYVSRNYKTNIHWNLWIYQWHLPFLMFDHYVKPLQQVCKCLLYVCMQFLCCCSLEILFFDASIHSISLHVNIFFLYLQKCINSFQVEKQALGVALLDVGEV